MKQFDDYKVFRFSSNILEMVEPLEETRSELIFATEPILSSLELSIPGYGRHASIVELDEVEVGIVIRLNAWSSY